jgi:hypothetical protein
LIAPLSILPGLWGKAECNVDEKDLDTLFRSVGEEPGTCPEGARRIFDILIRVTLDYRDRIFASRGLVVTVRDVRVSLSWLIPALATGNIPSLENPLSRELLEQWLDALKSSPDKREHEGLN